MYTNNYGGCENKWKRIHTADISQNGWDAGRRKYCKSYQSYDN